MNAPTRLFDILDNQVKTLPVKRALNTKYNGKWVSTSSEEFLEQSNQISRGLLQLGLRKGDKVAIISSNNRTEWCIVDIGVLQIGGIDVPIYPTITAEDYAYIINHSESKYCFVSDKDVFDKIKSIQKDCPNLKEVYSFDKISGCKHWTEVRDLGKNAAYQPKVIAIKESVLPHDLATIIYTSGTTGTPKGVMLSHNNIVSNVYASQKRLPLEFGKAIALSRTHFLVWLEVRYERLLRYAMHGHRAYAFVFGTVFMLILSFVLVGISQPKVEFFPDNQPTQIIVYIEYPQGTDIGKTNQITKSIEEVFIKTVNHSKYMDKGYNFMVESLVSQVGAGAGNPQTEGGSEAEMPHRGKITATMREFKFRRGLSSEDLRKEVQQALAGIFAGVSISVEKDQAGPPLGYPINIEIIGKDYGELIEVGERMRNFIIDMNIPGVEELKVDVNRNKPGMQIAVDRQKAGELGVSTGQVGFQLRQSLFGEKAGVYKKDGEDYNINVRFQPEDRYNQSALFNQYITFRDMASGQIKSIPVSAVTSRKNTSGYSAIKHRNLERVVTVYSAILPGYNAAEIVNQIKTQIEAFQLPADFRYRFTGEIEEQEENMAFLSRALLYALFLILVLLVLQFNSVSKPLIILFSVFMSFTGVFLGLVFFNMTFVIIMTMMGIISLAGIVVNNSVVLLDYTQLLLNRSRDEQGFQYDYHLDRSEIFDAIVNGGKARLRPVLLTAITTILGLIPLAVGLNINFFSLFTEGDPQIYIGGDNVIFWGPLAWTVIFGLTFATFLTLIIVPVAFFISKRAVSKLKNNN